MAQIDPIEERLDDAEIAPAEPGARPLDLARPDGGDQAQQPSLRRPSLGALMMQAGIASERDLKQAIYEGLQTGEKLGEIVVRKGWATDEVIGHLLAEQWQLPFDGGDDLVVDPSLDPALRAAALELGAIAVAGAAGGLRLAIAEPSQELFALAAERLGEASFLVVPGSAFDALRAQLEPVLDPAPAFVEPLGRAILVPAPEPPAAAPTSPSGSLAADVLASIDGAGVALERARVEINALAASLDLARDQLAEQEEEIEALVDDKEQSARAIQELRAELERRDSLFEDLREQAARLSRSLETT